MNPTFYDGPWYWATLAFFTALGITAGLLVLIP